MTSFLFLALAFVCLGLALWLFAAGRRTRLASGLPQGDIIYTDDGAWRPGVETLSAPAVGLTGRPDYLVEQLNGLVIPVEIKSTRAPRHPYRSHVLQLAAYCLLVTERYGVRPSHGILQYQDGAFAVDYTPELEQELRDTLDEMRDAFSAADLPRSHNSAARCSGCSLRAMCDQRLA